MKFEITKPNVANIGMSLGIMLGLVVLMAVLWALPTMLLWNWLMPAIFGFKTITFWQALGLQLLTKLLLTSSSSDSSSESKPTQIADSETVAKQIITTGF